MWLVTRNTEYRWMNAEGRFSKSRDEAKVFTDKEWAQRAADNANEWVCGPKVYVAPY
jgi:hypothetical protein